MKRQSMMADGIFFLTSKEPQKPKRSGQRRDMIGKHQMRNFHISYDEPLQFTLGYVYFLVFLLNKTTFTQL